MVFSEQDLADLKVAVALLEVPSLGARVVDMIGKPLEGGLERLPEKWQESISGAVDLALRKALEMAQTTMSDPQQQKSSDWMHMSLATMSGAAGGFVGLAALPVELPITTTIILRSIVDIARSEGEDIHSPAAVVSCLEVFAFGSGRTATDDASETGYYTVRVALAKVVSDAASHLAKAGAVDTAKKTTAPALVRLIESLAARFGVQVSEKAIATLIPVIGAGLGAAINAVFMDHYQSIARGHFIVRRLERDYGEAAVQEQYSKIARQSSKPTNKTADTLITG